MPASEAEREMTKDERKHAKRVEMSKKVGYWSDTAKKGEQVFQSN